MLSLLKPFNSPRFKKFLIVLLPIAIITSTIAVIIWTKVHHNIDNVNKYQISIRCIEKDQNPDQGFLTLSVKTNLANLGELMQKYTKNNLFHNPEYFDITWYGFGGFLKGVRNPLTNNWLENTSTHFWLIYSSDNPSCAGQSDHQCGAGMSDLKLNGNYHFDWIYET